MRMRLLYVCRTWAMGGAQSILLSLIRRLPPERFEILVAPWDAGIDADRTFASEAGRAGARLTAPLRWAGWRSSRSVVGALSDLVAAERVDVLHCHDNVTNMLVGLSRRRFPGATVASAFGWWEINLKLRFLYAAERRLALPRFDAVYTVSDDMAGKLRRSGVAADRIDVIRTGIDAGLWSPRGRRAELRAAWGIPPEATVLGTVGRISAEKGHDHLLGAVRRLTDRHPGLVVLLAGKGPDMERLAGLARGMNLADRLIMPGYVADGAAAYEAMDIAVMPSVLDEGLPTAALEAQAAGLPIVASDIGGTRETLVDGGTGRLAPPGDADALAVALAPLVEDPALRARMGAAAQARILGEFSLDGMLDALCAFYERAAQGARRR